MKRKKGRKNTRPSGPQRKVLPAGTEKRMASLRPVILPAEVEDLARKLYAQVCQGSQSMLPIERTQFEKDADLRRKFYSLVHAGMWAAQESFLERIKLGDLTPTEEAIYRTAMDAIAWQMLQGQLCYVRRVFRGQKQPNLSTSNLDSVVAVARKIREESPDSMPLIADLTTFVQIGDLLCSGPTRETTIIEVKDGEHNHEIGKLATFYQSSQCEQFKKIVSETQTSKSYKQFERMVRQMDRMEFMTEVLETGSATDPDSGQKLHIPDPVFPLDQWDEELLDLFDKADKSGYALTTIDDCIFVACYTEDPMKAASPAAFLMWYEKYAAGSMMPVAKLTDCVVQPLAMPLFALPMPLERIMDVLMGRMHVCMGVSVPLLVEQCRKYGITVRGPNKGERRAISQQGADVIRLNNVPLVVELNGKSLILSSGIFVRLLHYFQRPISLFHMMFENWADEESISPPTHPQAS